MRSSHHHLILSRETACRVVCKVHLDSIVSFTLSAIVVVEWESLPKIRCAVSHTFNLLTVPASKRGVLLPKLSAKADVFM